MLARLVFLALGFLLAGQYSEAVGVGLRRSTSGVGVVYVATTGLDTNQGSQVSPFLTLGRAQTELRNMGGGTAIIRGGTYVLSSTLALTSADNNTVWMSYPGESAIISGGSQLSGWTLHDAGNSIWKTSTGG